MATGSQSRRILIVEPDVDGHHAFWLISAVLAFQRAGWQVSVLGAAEHEAVRNQSRLLGLEWQSVDWHLAGESGTGGRRLLAEAARLAERLAAERVFFSFLDKLWDGLLTAPKEVWRALAGRAEGIWFHPYALDAKWRWAPPVGKRWRQRGRLHRFLRSPRGSYFFKHLWFLVDEAPRRIARLNPRIGASVVPDPYEREPLLKREQARARFGLPEDRMLFLHLGSAEPRKGLPDVLEAFQNLSRRPDPAWPQAPFLLRVGPNGRLGAQERRALDELVAKGWAAAVEKFVPAEDLMEYFAAADWVLIPYRKFRYSSGILANAFGARRPVIAANHGHIGRETARSGAGVLYPHASPAGLTRALASVLSLREPVEARAQALEIARAGKTVERLQFALANPVSPQTLEGSP